jgi:hypothetical protein
MQRKLEKKNAPGEGAAPDAADAPAPGAAETP